ncbi:uncharacterized protein [Rutidosis leptorrhynchoides]|uniref:uncharacterized protein n=1 Tax=Rutidosis leptorrhynchoides TaxID=125765 RepID=UPI003A991070
MGLSLSSSKRVAGKLNSSPEFITACTTIYQQSISLAQQTFPGILLYQIPSASNRLYETLTTLQIPLIQKWVTAPPTRSQIDKSLQKVTKIDDADAIVVLDEAAFKEFAIELYADLIVANAEKEVLVKVPVGVVGIVGVGVFGRFGVEVVGTVAGVYAVGVATSVYLSLGG